MRAKATNQQIIDAYKSTGSVWRAGKALGMAGQTVHDRLRALDYPIAARKWLPDEIAELRALAPHATISEVASRLGRPYTGVAGKISELGIGVRFGNRNRPVAVPRGAGYDKRSCDRYRRQIDQAGISVHQFARRNSLGVETLCKALERHFPDWWQAYRRAHSDLPEIECPYCRESFVPSTGKQRFCSRKCAEDDRTDRAYFGGKRRDTIGLAQGICQLCGREGRKGLTPHHVIGKENDPGNELLIALCRGCHQVVTLLAARDFVGKPSAWEALISLVLMRKDGAANGSYRLGTYVSVEMEPLTEDDLAEQAPAGTPPPDEED